MSRTVKFNLLNVTINFAERRNKGPLYFKSDRISALKCFLSRNVSLALPNLEWLCISRSMSNKALDKTLDSNRGTLYASCFTLRVLFCKISYAWVHPSTRSKICFIDVKPISGIWIHHKQLKTYAWLSIDDLYHLLKSWFSWVVAIKTAWKWDSVTDCLDLQSPVQFWLTNIAYDKSYCPCGW